MNNTKLARTVALNALANIQPGSFHRYTFASVVNTVNGEYIEKICTVNARTKINSHNCKDYVAPATNRTYTNNDVDVLADKNGNPVRHCVSLNTKTGNERVLLHVRKGCKIRSCYVDANGKELDKAYVESVKKPSSARSYDPDRHIIMTPNLLNFIEIF